MPEQIAGWKAGKPTGSYVVRIPGQDDQRFSDFSEAANTIIAHKGYAILIDPHGEVMLTKGVPPEPDA